LTFKKWAYILTFIHKQMGINPTFLLHECTREEDVLLGYKRGKVPCWICIKLAE
jgi:hypothetical protein